MKMIIAVVQKGEKMDDTISRQAAIDAVLDICEKCDSGHCGVCRVNYPGEYDCIKTLKELPSERPDVIRCKDCKHFREEVCNVKNTYALGFCPFINSHLVMREGYCSWAERKGNG